MTHRPEHDRGATVERLRLVGESNPEPLAEPGSALDLEAVYEAWRENFKGDNQTHANVRDLLDRAPRDQAAVDGLLTEVSGYLALIALDAAETGHSQIAAYGSARLSVVRVAKAGMLGLGKDEDSLDAVIRVAFTAAGKGRAEAAPKAEPPQPSWNNTTGPISDRNRATEIKEGPGSISDPETRRDLDTMCDRLDIERGGLNWISPETAEILLRYPSEPDETG